MPEAEKTRPIDLRISIRGQKNADRLIAMLHEKFSDSVEILTDDEEEMVDVFKTEWYKQTSSTMTPGDVLRIRRENAGLSQAALGDLIGSNRQNISAMETGRRPIGKAIADRLATALGLPAGALQRQW